MNEKVAIYLLQQIHQRLKLDFGSLQEEYPEQLMAVMFINKDARVLEIGGNIGRNSCVIASILNDSRNLLVLESNKDIAEQLQHNRDINGLKFNIEAKALSKRLLMQKGWDTYPMTGFTIRPGFKKVATISWQDLCNKYMLPFDTLVADCEGALYHILMDEPDMLQQFHTVIMENDYTDIEHKKYVDETLINNGFRAVFRKSLDMHIEKHFPCKDYFFEVWKK